MEITQLQRFIYWFIMRNREPQFQKYDRPAAAFFFLLRKALPAERISCCYDTEKCPNYQRRRPGSRRGGGNRFQGDQRPKCERTLPPEGRGSHPEAELRGEYLRQRAEAPEEQPDRPDHPQYHQSFFRCFCGLY